MTPIYKGKGSRHDAGNYRPVSQTSVPCKVMEKTVREGLMQHLELNKLISPHQHGFLPKHSTQIQLLEFWDDITTEVDKGNKLDIAYLDISKAFDTVSHQKLLRRLDNHGIRGDLLRWCEAFLGRRLSQNPAPVGNSSPSSQSFQ